jgi:hypothetical protein
MKKSTLIIALILLITQYGMGQDGPFGYYQDALRYSRTDIGGTARVQAIGGAQVALGGDLSAAHANPAGLGFMNSSVMSFSTAMDFANTQSVFNDGGGDDFKAIFNFPQLGAAFYIENLNPNSKLYGGTVAVTMTRTNNFHRATRYSGINYSPLGQSSIVDSWLDVANNGGNPIAPNSLPDLEYYALDHGLIVDFYDENDELSYYGKWIGDQPIQYEEIRETGAQYDWNFAGGINYGDFLYLGTGLVISTINYYYKSVYDEYDFYYDGAPDESIDYLSTQEVIRHNGTGVSGNMGIIIRPVDIIRLGFSATTPTYYGIREDYQQDLVTRYLWDYVDLEDGTRLELDENNFNEYLTYSKWNLTTPWKLSGGSAIFLGKYGFISFDVDYLDYSQSRISSRDFNGQRDTEEVQNLFQSTINYRAGAEIRLENFRLRGGYAYDGDPYANSSIDQSLRRITAGLGYRNKAFFTDLSFVHSKWNSQKRPYTMYDYSGTDPVDVSPVANIVNKNFNFTWTLGVNF